MNSRHRRSGFSLIELTVSIAILALLSSLAFPAFDKALERARSLQCGQNLRQIGVAVLSAAQDNDNKYPKINDAYATASGTPYYPNDPDAKTLPDTLGPYGITGNVLRCPNDVRAQNRYATYNCSYMWQPFADDESDTTNSVNFYGRMRNGQQIFQVSTARIRIVTDIDAIHYNRFNTLYADGHVNVATGISRYR